MTPGELAGERLARFNEIDTALLATRRAVDTLWGLARSVRPRLLSDVNEAAFEVLANVHRAEETLEQLHDLTQGTVGGEVEL